MEPTRHLHRKGFNCVIFRRTCPQITEKGGLWDTSMEIYPGLGGVPREGDLEWRFPRWGSSVQFCHMEHAKDRLNWDGSQIALIGFDQLESFLNLQFVYMLSRNRSMCGIAPYVRATCNPADPGDPDQVWLRTLLDWWIDEETGYAIPERSGVVRWFVRGENDEPMWADTRRELVEEYGEDSQPLSLTFIVGHLEENKIMLAKNPGYLAKLKGLLRVERERLLEGNWNVRLASGEYFSRADLPIVEAAPAGRDVRYWDRAATEKQPGAKKQSATAGVRLREVRVGSGCMWYVVDVIRIYAQAHDVAQKIKTIASQDGNTVQIGLEQDPGQAGKAEVQDLARQLGGYNVYINAVHESKGVRAIPLARQAQAGNVKLVRGAWNEAFINEAQNFDGTDKSVSDQVDAADGAFFVLNSAPRYGGW